MKTILVVDDKRENLDLAKKQLGTICYLHLVSTFSAARDILNKEIKFDAVFTDVMLIGESEGIALTNPEIGKEVPYGPIIALLAKNLNIEHVVLVTDLSHHSGPIAWALDVLMDQKGFVSCIRTKDWLEAYKLCFGEVAKKDIYYSEEPPLDMLVIGVNHEIYYNQLMESFPGLSSMYLDVKDVSIENTFITRNPKRTLILGELDDRAEKYNMTKIFNLLLELKLPEQKVLAAGFFSCNHKCYLRMPFSPDNLKKKFEEIK